LNSRGRGGEERSEQNRAEERFVVDVAWRKVENYAAHRIRIHGSAGSFGGAWYLMTGEDQTRI